jgi:hypothetical protein
MASRHRRHELRWINPEVFHLDENLARTGGRNLVLTRDEGLSDLFGERCLHHCHLWLVEPLDSTESRTRFRRRALATTVKEESAIAAPASIGDIDRPVNG